MSLFHLTFHPFVYVNVLMEPYPHTHREFRYVFWFRFRKKNTKWRNEKEKLKKKTSTYIGALHWADYKITHFISNKCRKMCVHYTQKRTPTYPSPDSILPIFVFFFPLLCFICQITFFWFNNSAIVLRFTCSNWIRFNTFRLRLKNDNLIKGLFSFNVTRIIYIRMDIRILLVYISVQRTLNAICNERSSKFNVK